MKIQEGSGPLVDSLPFTGGEYERRLAAIRSEMTRRQLDAFISFTPENIYYLTGHDSPGYYFYQACVVTHKQRPVNVLRRIETTNTLGRSWSRLTVGYEDREDPVEATLALLGELGVANRKVGAEGMAWFVAPLRYIQLQNGVARASGQFVDGSGIVEELRVIKTPEELAYIRQGARTVERAMRAGIEASHEGTNENEVAAAMPVAVTVHNISNRSQTTNNVISDMNFSLDSTDCPASLGIDAKCTVNLRFGPRTSGPFSGYLTFTIAEGTPQLTLTGKGQ